MSLTPISFSEEKKKQKKKTVYNFFLINIELDTRSNDFYKDNRQDSIGLWIYAPTPLQLT